MTQFPVKSNIATTWHKLQGQIKHYIIIGTWNYRCRNWIYVVLLRVNTLNGLLLTNRLNGDQAKYRIRDDILNKEKRLDDLDKKFQVDINWEQTFFFGFDG